MPTSIPPSTDPAVIQGFDHSTLIKVGKPVVRKWKEGDEEAVEITQGYRCAYEVVEFELSQPLYDYDTPYSDAFEDCVLVSKTYGGEDPAIANVEIVWRSPTASSDGGLVVGPGEVDEEMDVSVVQQPVELASYFASLTASQ